MPTTWIKLLKQNFQSILELLTKRAVDVYVQLKLNGHLKINNFVYLTAAIIIALLVYELAK
jgi:hypothetical protein